MKNLKASWLVAHSKKISKIYVVPFLLSVWGIANVFYWEVYKGYKACTFCKWHRGLYFGLFMALICLVKFRKCFFKLAVIIMIAMETIVGFMQVFGWGCDPMMCRRVSMPEKINVVAAAVSLILVVLVELYVFLKPKK